MEIVQPQEEKEDVVAKQPKLKLFLGDDEFNILNDRKFHIWIDEAGRGPLLGSLFVAAVMFRPQVMHVLREWQTQSSGPGVSSETVTLLQELFPLVHCIQDSKQFSKAKPNRVTAVQEGKTTRKRTAKGIVKHTLDDVANSIHSCCTVAICEKTAAQIDEVNILRATMTGMHDCVRQLLDGLQEEYGLDDVCIWVDGDRFDPFLTMSTRDKQMGALRHELVVKGDATLLGIAAASIVAKQAHDRHIYALCDENEMLDTNYGLRTNVGYGTKQHREGIVLHGPCVHHRTTFLKNRDNWVPVISAVHKTNFHIENQLV